MNCSYRKKLPEGGEMRQTAISSPCLPPLLFLIGWNHSVCESVLCLISGLFCGQGEAELTELEMSPVLAAQPGLDHGCCILPGTYGTSILCQCMGPAQRLSAKLPRSIFSILPPAQAEFCSFSKPRGPYDWNHRPQGQLLPLYPNTIVLHRHTLRGAPHHSAISAFLLLVKALRFPHPLIAISLVSFFTGKWHQERHSTTNFAN